RAVQGSGLLPTVLSDGTTSSLAMTSEVMAGPLDSSHDRPHDCDRRPRGTTMTSAADATGHLGAFAIAYWEDTDSGPEVIEYIERSEETFTPYGGEWLVHGSLPEPLEGDVPGIVVIIGFPTPDAVRTWYASSAYQDIVPLRAEHS